MTRVITWPILSIFLKWNTERLELAQGYVEFLWHVYHKKVGIIVVSVQSISAFGPGSFGET